MALKRTNLRLLKLFNLPHKLPVHKTTKNAHDFSLVFGSKSADDLVVVRIHFG
jgi:hypothetical protein